MIAFGLGLPLLVWRRYPGLSRLYIRFSLVFVLGSLLSNALLDACVLTRLAQWLWEAGGGHAERVPFIVTFTNRVASIRPSNDAAVLVWELAIALYCIVGLWGWRAHEHSEKRMAPRSSPHPAGGPASSVSRC
ncbi:MAG: hypothetical protein RL033_5038 [Pseudomonadota bacterium]|jgi:hypothetical protein